MRSDDVLILVHGYNKSESDMKFLKNNFEKLGYSVFTETIPLLFSSIEQCVEIFKIKVEKILKEKEKYNKVHFIGHSMGGIIIRKFLEKNRVEKIGRCILIATPNRGMKLSDFAA